MGNQANPGGGAQPRLGSVASRLGATRTILVFEDEPDMARFLGAFFRASGMNLDHCNPSSVAGAIEALVDHQVDCVLLDVRLEHINGLDILEAMRADPRISSIPVIVITADYLSDVAPRAAALQVAVIRKPFDVREVFQLVEELIGQEPDPPAEQPAQARDADAGPEARMLSITDLQVRLARALDGSHSHVGLAVVRIRAVDGRPPAPTTVEAAAHALVRTLEQGEVLGCSHADEIAVLYVDAHPAEASADLDAAVSRVVGCTGHAGLAIWPDQASTADELYMAADAAAADAAEARDPVRLAR
jgi:CheY-like chemotaxis protein